MLNESQLVEALHIKRLSRQDSLLLVLAVSVIAPKKVLEIKRLGRNAGFTEIYNWNVSDILKRSNGLAIRLPAGWSLSPKGKTYVNNLRLSLPKKSMKIVNQAKQLRQVVSQITNIDTRSFLEEALVTYEAGLCRSSVVLSWAGAISLLYDVVMSKCLPTFNAEANRRDPKWKHAKIKEDLSRMKESTFFDIIGSPPISIIGKNLKLELKNNCLQLRNSCGHPNSLIIGENKTSAHLEVLIQNVFLRFK